MSIFQILFGILPLTILGSSDIHIVTGTATTCVVDNYELRCWGDNGWGQLGIGSTSDLKSPPTDPIDLGTDFQVESVCGGTSHTCAKSVKGTTKCFGGNSHGTLGQGHTLDIGDGPDEMGDNLPEINWGSGFVVDQIICQGISTCALSTSGIVKCVGYAGDGALGISGKQGDDASEIGDVLQAVDLGDSFDITWIGARGAGGCALSSAKELKCWGPNGNGQLGQGDTTNRGGDAEAMGDNLVAIDLGSEFEIDRVYTAGSGVCVVSTDHDLKCFGDNEYGQLGLGDTNNRGDEANEMGDFLPIVDLGTDFIVADLTGGLYHQCALSMTAKIKCWGRNQWGQLGYGDTVTRGAESGEMGDALPTVDLGTGFDVIGISHGSTKDYHHCAVGTSSGELKVKCWGENDSGRLGYGDTKKRGDGAGEMGDALPFLDIDIVVCSAESQHSVVWQDVMNGDGTAGAVLLRDHSVVFDASSLSLTFSATVEYVGNSSDGNFNDDSNLGTTYWVDFESFSSVDGGVSAPGTCANRRSSDYDGLAFGQFWKYPVNPMALETMDTAERMAYPPSNWSLTANDCNAVVYERTMSWTDLTSCQDAAGNGLISVTETAATVLLEGTLFVELVSPYSMSSSGYFRTFPVLQQDFGIALSRQVDVLATTGVQLFISSVMAYGRDDDGNYLLTVLTQSADYVMLQMDDVNAIGTPDGLSVSVIETVNADCLMASSFTCGQIFTATIPAQCPDDATATDTVDLSGKYQFSFTPQCRANHEPAEACNVFMTTLDGTAGKVVLDVSSSFQDACDLRLFEVTFGGALTFYSDAALSVVADGSVPFVIGQDTIYGKVTVGIPSDEEGARYQFVGVSIENVYVCTAADDVDLSVDADAGTGGCLSSLIDADGPYKVIGVGADEQYQGTTIVSSANNEAAFSFLTFDTPRESIAVHAQLLLTLVDESGSRRRVRRRMLLQEEAAEGNAFQSYIGSAAVQNAESASDPDDIDGAAAAFSVGATSAMLVMSIICTAMMMM